MKEDEGFQDFHQTLDVHDCSHDCSSHFKPKHLYAPFLCPVEELDAGSPSVCLAALVARTASQEQNCSLNSSNVKSKVMTSGLLGYLGFAST